jgi:hypothetical protein
MQKQWKARFGITMSQTTLKKVDEKRGDMARAPYIECCVQKYFELEGLKEDDLKFYQEILTMLRSLMTEEKRGKVLSGISLINSKMSEKREQLLSIK